MTVDTVNRMIRAVFEDAAVLFDRKYAQRGPHNITQSGGLAGVLARLSDKTTRVITAGPSEDDLIDIINYAAIGALIMRGLWPTNSHTCINTTPHMAYLAAPIDSVRADNRNSVTTTIDQIRESLARRGISIFIPASAWSWRRGDVDAARLIARINSVALTSASLLVAILPPGVATYGTIEEIIRAEEMKMPVIIVTEPRHSVFTATRSNTCHISDFDTMLSRVISGGAI